MKSNKASVWPIATIVISLLRVGAASAEEPIRLSVEERDRYYAMTIAAKGRVDPSIEFGFVENVPLIAKIKMASSEIQCYAALTLYAYRQANNRVAGVFMNEIHQARKNHTGLSVQQTEILKAIAEIVEEPPTGSERLDRGTVERTILSLVPSAEQLAKQAGYVNPQLELTSGLAMGLFLHARLQQETAEVAIPSILRERFVSTRFRVESSLPWESVKSAINRNVPFVLTGQVAYLVVGYMQGDDGERILFAFDPRDIERQVRYGGRYYAEGQLKELVAKGSAGGDVIPDTSLLRHYDWLFTHKEIQLPGFCAARFQEGMRAVYIESIEPDTARIRNITQRAFAVAAERSRRSKTEEESK